MYVPFMVIVPTVLKINVFAFNATIHWKVVVSLIENTVNEVAIGF